MLAEALTRMQVLETTLSADKTAFYAKLEVDAPASVADARLLQSRLSDQTATLWDHWQVAGGVRRREPKRQGHSRRALNSVRHHLDNFIFSRQMRS